MIVYADLYCIMNFAADLVLLKLVTRDLRVPRWRLIAGAATGSLGALALIALPGNVIRIAASLGLALLMLGITLQGRRQTRWLKSLGLLYGYGFLMGGFVQTLYEWILVSSGHRYYEAIYAIGLWLLLILVCDWLLSCFYRKYGSPEKRRQLMEIVIGFRGAEVALTGFMDTGNELTEPITGYPVIVVLQRQEWNPASWTEGADETVYLIPYRTASSETACMLGFRPDYVSWNGGRTDEVVVAVSRQKQFDPKNQYEVLLSPRLITTQSKRRLSVCGKR